MYNYATRCTCCLLGPNTVSCGWRVPTFQKIQVTPLIGMDKRPRWWRQQHNFYQTKRHHGLISSVNKERQSTYNVTFRRVHETTVAVEKHKYYIFLCLCVCVRAWVRASSVTYLVCHAQAPHCGPSASTMPPSLSTLSCKIQTQADTFCQRGNKLKITPYYKQVCISEFTLHKVRVNKMKSHSQSDNKGTEKRMWNVLRSPFWGFIHTERSHHEYAITFLRQGAMHFNHN
jgi:hypothetical protein